MSDTAFCIDYILYYKTGLYNLSTFLWFAVIKPILMNFPRKNTHYWYINLSIKYVVGSQNIIGLVLKLIILYPH